MKSRSIILLIVVLFIIVLIRAILWGYSAPWTGFGNYTTPNGDYARGKTLWDWMELLVIPLVLAFGAFYLNRSERAVERQAAEDRAKLEREIAADRQQEARLQSYLDRMAKLLLRENLRVSENEELRNVARIRTLSVLRGLDANRKRMVLLFLYESGLIVERSTIDLTGANLSGANLSGTNLTKAQLFGANLFGADLREAQLLGADLKNADLFKTKLIKANLNGANLSGANLNGADLLLADLVEAILEEAKLQFANLNGANLSRANLRGADLWRAHLIGAHLIGANLSEAAVSNTQLSKAQSLHNATMPDGTKHD